MDGILGYARLCTQVLDSSSSACPVALGHRGCVPAGDPQSTSLNFPGHVLLSYYCFLLLLSSHHPQGIKNIYKNIAVGRRKVGVRGNGCPNFQVQVREPHTEFQYTGKRKHIRLAGCVRFLKDEGLDYEIKWLLLVRASIYKLISKTFRSYLSDKFRIMHSRQDMASLNVRAEIISSCLRRENPLL